ncbi:MAG TPA: hypothetical protein VJ499_12410 [Flavisolibacter sp.]|nr:hypothetical protein [Flavisolibacter sp.]
MQNFQRQVQTATNGIIEFHFEVVHSRSKQSLLVTAFENGRKITFFNMEKKDDNWRIIDAPKVGDRFLEMEKKLEAMIKDFEREDH